MNGECSYCKYQVTATIVVIHVVLASTRQLEAAGSSSRESGRNSLTLFLLYLVDDQHVFVDNHG